MENINLEIIAQLVREGYVRGYEPIIWSIDIEDEDNIEIIADMIEEGYTSGYCPNWSLNIEY